MTDERLGLNQTLDGNMSLGLMKKNKTQAQAMKAQLKLNWKNFSLKKLFLKFMYTNKRKY